MKDKIVLVLRYFPEDAEPKTKGILSRYSDLRYKAMAARQHGAKAILIVSGPNSPNAGEIIPMSFDTALAGSGIVAASISGSVADAMFSTLGDPAKTLKAAQTALDDANPHAAGFALPNVTVTLHTDVVREKRTGHNVLAYLPATSGASVPKPWVGIGAHYDHLGRGESGSSLAETNDAGTVHHGADDNASGTAAVLALGELLSTQPRTRNVMLQFWSGEELGLIGSNAFVNAPAVPLDQLAAYVNFDMVGRMVDNKLSVQATGSSPVWARLVEQANIAAGFDLQIQQDPYQPTDVAPFNQAGVPSINFFTGTHADYHKPSDTADKINYEDLDRVVDLRGRHRAPPRRHRRRAAVHQGGTEDRHRWPCGRAGLHRHDSRLLHRGEGLAAERGDRRRTGGTGRTGRRATSSSRSPARRSPTSTTTRMRWKC